MPDPRAALAALFDADRSLRAAEEGFLDSGDESRLGRAISEAARAAFELSDPDEQELRLVRLADLCAQVPSPQTIDVLLGILDHDEPAVRNEAGECLLDLAYERFKEVARGVEALLDRGHDGPAMEELPFVLTEIHDPDPLPLVARFLAHPKAEVVAAAIEALASYGDPAAVRHLRKLVSDAREVTIPDLDDARATLGDLAADAIAQLDEPSA